MLPAPADVPLVALPLVADPLVPDPDVPLPEVPEVPPPVALRCASIAFVSMYCALPELPDWDDVPLDEVALPDVPEVPDVAVPAVLAFCRHPVTVTWFCSPCEREPL